MQFKPGQDVPLFFEDGAQVSARPFFVVGPGRKGLVAELFTAAGVRICCVDEPNDLFTLGEGGRALRLAPPIPPVVV